MCSWDIDRVVEPTWKDSLLGPYISFGIPSSQKKVRTNLHTHIAQPCANEIATEESNKIVNDKQFKIRISGLTIKSLTELLSPDAIMTAYKESAPFTWEFLSVWATSENEYRKKQQQKRSAQDKGKEMEELEGDESDWDYDPNLDEAQLPKKKQSGYGAYARNSVLVCTRSMFS